MVDQFLNNTFVRFQAQNPDEKALPSYRHYSLQDYYYLLDFVKYRALRLAAVPDISNTELESYLASETKSMADFAAYASKFRNDTLVKELKINSTEIENGTRTVAELAYSNWLQKNEDSGWFTLYVKSIPCVYGWQKLAQKLHDDGNTNKSTKFYKTWIEPNMNSSSGKKLSALLDKYVERYNTTYMYSIWNSTFVEALQFEINFFNDSLNKTL
ncbi:hypothetical protein DIS24_g8932 [Lasiodiplodia hormozganensis]|uniref:Thiaminase-2/PQQC domain-containing protein n=1 Tax=Lasiodiplodia hormozganensis TaxID=869390 RepID=A0AA39XY95_9PEZI|nr:hypothetical protein DIS24_g8932 [Lasiodiplodia hormozganensis]